MFHEDSSVGAAVMLVTMLSHHSTPQRLCCIEALALHKVLQKNTFMMIIEIV